MDSDEGMRIVGVSHVGRGADGQYDVTETWVRGHYA